MKNDSLKGHLSIGAAYLLFGLNVVFCKDIANSGSISPIVLFSLRAAGASALFWLLSLFAPREKVDRGDLPKIAAASMLATALFSSAIQAHQQSSGYDYPEI